MFFEPLEQFEIVVNNPSLFNYHTFIGFNHGRSIVCYLGLFYFHLLDLFGLTDWNISLYRVFFFFFYLHF